MATQFTYTMQIEIVSLKADGSEITSSLLKSFDGELTTQNYSYETSKTIYSDSLESLFENEIRSYEEEKEFIENSTNILRYSIYSLNTEIQCFFDDGEYVSYTSNSDSNIGAYLLSNGEAPGPVDFFSAQSDLNSILFTWTDSNVFHQGYKIIDERKNIIAILSKNTVSWVETNLDPNTTYTRELLVFNSYGDSEGISIDVTTEESGFITNPDSPTNFRGITNGTTAITWYWNPVQGATSYIIKSVNGEEIAVVSDNQYEEVNLTPDTLYKRYVFAKNGLKISNSSELAIAFTDAVIEFTPLNAPTNFRGTVLGEKTILWQWDKGSEFEELQYRIYDQNGEILYETPTGFTEFLEEDLNPGTQYRHHVRSFNSNSESANSNYAFVTTLPSDTNDEEITDEEEWNLEKVVCPIIQPLIEKRLSAFQSGIGHGLDLKVKVNNNNIAKEKFSYYFQLKGIAQQVYTSYPKINFRYRFIAEGLNGNEEWTEITEWYYGFVNGKEPLNENTYGKNSFFLVVQIKVPEEVVIDSIKVEIDNEQINYIFANGITENFIHYTKNNGDSIEFYCNEGVETILEESYYGPIIENNSTQTIYENQELIINDKIISPLIDPFFSVKAIMSWELIIVSNNSNVEIKLDNPLPYPWPVDEDLIPQTVIPIRLKGKLINPSQSSWHPSIHSGFYYLNQDEFYLYGETNVRGQGYLQNEISIVEFPFVLQVELEKIGEASSKRIYYTTRNDWSQKIYRIDINTNPGDLMLEKNLGSYYTTGYFESEIIGLSVSGVQSLGYFRYLATFPEPTNESNQFEEANIEIQTSVYAFGIWSIYKNVVITNTIPQESGKVLFQCEIDPSLMALNFTKIKVKINLYASAEVVENDFNQFITSVADFNYDNVLYQNINFNQGGYIEISKNQNNEVYSNGYWYSPIIDLGEDYINYNTSQVPKIYYEPSYSISQSGQAIELMTVSSDSPEGPWDGTGEDSPLVPLGFVETIEGKIQGTIQSSKKRYLRYRAYITKGKEFSTTITGTPNLNETIEFISEPYFINQLEEYYYINLSFVLPPRNGGVNVYTRTSNNLSDIQSKEWEDAVSINSSRYRINSFVNSYIQVKVELINGKSNIISKSYTDTTLQDFAAGTVYNVGINQLGYFSLSDVRTEGHYISKVFNFTNAEAYKQLSKVASGNSNIIIQTSTSQNGIDNWTDWENVSSNGQINSQVFNYLKYKVILSPIINQVTIGISYNSSLQLDGTINNLAVKTNTKTIVSSGQITQIDPSLQGIYISPVAEINDYSSSLSLAYVSSISDGGSIETYTRTSTDNISWNDWSLLPSNGVINLASRYFQFKSLIGVGYSTSFSQKTFEFGKNGVNNFTGTGTNLSNIRFTTTKGLNLISLESVNKELLTGVYESSVLDFSGNITSIDSIFIARNLPSLNGYIKIYTATSNSKESITSNPVWNLSTQLSSTTYRIESQIYNPYCYLRYKIEMQSGYSALSTIPELFNSDSKFAGYTSIANISIVNNTLRLSAGTSSGTYVSGKINFINLYGIWENYLNYILNVTAAENGGEVYLRIRTASTPEGIDTATYTLLGMVSGGIQTFNDSIFNLSKNSALEKAGYLQYQIYIKTGYTAALSYETELDMTYISANQELQRYGSKQRLFLTDPIVHRDYINMQGKTTRFIFSNSSNLIYTNMGANVYDAGGNRVAGVIKIKDFTYGPTIEDGPYSAAQIVASGTWKPYIKKIEKVKIDLCGCSNTGGNNFAVNETIGVNYENVYYMMQLWRSNNTSFNGNSTFYPNGGLGKFGDAESGVEVQVLYTLNDNTEIIDNMILEKITGLPTSITVGYSDSVKLHFISENGNTYSNIKFADVRVRLHNSYYNILAGGKTNIYNGSNIFVNYISPIIADYIEYEYSREIRTNQSPIVNSLTINSNARQVESPSLSYIKLETPLNTYKAFKESTISNIGLGYIKNEYSSPSVDSITVNADTYEIMPTKLTSLYLHSKTYEWVSPKLNNTEVNIQRYSLVKNTPILHEIDFELNMNSVRFESNYNIPLYAKIKADTKYYEIESSKYITLTNTMKEITDVYVRENNISEVDVARTQYRLISSDSELFNIKAGSINNDGEFTESLSSYLSGEAKIFAAAKQSSSESVLTEAKIIVSNNQAFVMPAPKQGAPILVKDAQGYLEQVNFIDENQGISLFNKEEFIIIDKPFVKLMYKNADENSIIITIEKISGEEESITDFRLCEEILYLPEIYPIYTKVKVQYAIKRSFYIDVNQSTDSYSLIRLNGAVLGQENQIYIQYETNDSQTYYESEEIDFNPIKSKVTEGFLYITDEIHEASKIEIDINPTYLYSNGYDKTTIIARVYDKYGNAVIGNNIRFLIDEEKSTTTGTLIVEQNITDKNGIAYATITSGKQSGLIYIQVRNTNAMIEYEKEIKIEVKDNRKRAHLYLKLDKNEILGNGIDKVTIKATLVNEQKQPIVNELLVIEHGTETDYEITNQLGEVYLDIAKLNIIEDKTEVISVYSSEFNLKEYATIQVLEVN